MTSCCFVSNEAFELVNQSCSIDGKDYLVRGDVNSLEAANILAMLVKKLNKLANMMIHINPKDQRALKLSHVLSTVLFMENNRENHHDTSVTINKGEIILLCLTIKKDHTSSFVEFSTLFYIALHELAHCISLSVGHTEEFWKIFRYLLHNAVRWKVWELIDYRKQPKMYCGEMLTSSPLRLSHRDL